jgi:signal transduction histidine kinase
VVSATAWRERYTTDLFFRTTVNIVALQMGLVVLCIGALLWALRYPSFEWIAFGIIAVMAALFGLIMAQYTLRPTRNSLRYQKIFISNVAHELRTPLSTIKTSAEVLLMDDGIPADVRTTCNEIVIELDRISEIINNLLSLDTLTRPERIKLGNVDLRPLLDKVVDKHMSLARERGIRISVKKDSYATVLGNPTALEQVMTNIIKNALSYTPKNTGGNVSISIGPDYHGSIIFAVADTGIGIAEEDLQHIFEPFYRADTSRVRNVKKTGSGIGLTIVNDIVRVHRGKIRIESAKRKGTTVVVSLPSGAMPGEHAANEQHKRSEIAVDFSTNTSNSVEPSTTRVGLDMKR